MPYYPRTVAGYSGTPLAKKLGVKEGFRLALIDAPEGFDDDLAPLPDGVTIVSSLDGLCDVTLLFSTALDHLTPLFEEAMEHLPAAGGLWIAWPKKASKVPTDLSFDVVQGLGLGHGLVDNKSCAVSDVFSGLRFVVRLVNRGTWSPTAGS